MVVVFYQPCAIWVMQRVGAGYGLKSQIRAKGLGDGCFQVVGKHGEQNKNRAARLPWVSGLIEQRWISGMGEIKPLWF